MYVQYFTVSVNKIPADYTVKAKLQAGDNSQHQKCIHRWTSFEIKCLRHVMNRKRLHTKWCFGYQLQLIFQPVHTVASLAASTELALCLPEPVETFTVAGLSSLSFKRNPLQTSCETTPALNCEDSSRAMASCTCKENTAVLHDE